MSSSHITLSKSRYVQGWQCPKALYLEKFHPELKAEVTEMQQAVFDLGHTVGDYAQQYFPGGIDATQGDYSNFKAAMAYTQELIASGQQVIYEAGFQYEGNMCYMDILVNREGKWYAYEVKGAASVHEYYLHDTSFQYYVITQSGLPLEDIFLMHIDSSYVREGDLDLEQLFKQVSLKEKVLEKQDEVKSRIKVLRQMLQVGEEPDIEIGPHCSSPFECGYFAHCWSHIPSYSIFNISRLTSKKKFKLYKSGIINFDEIPDNAALNDRQWMQVEAELQQREYIDKKNIQRFLDTLHYPLYFMDFEAFSAPIPPFDKSQAYHQICFQYSLHVQQSPEAEIEHYEFLGTPPDDPRPAFIQSLISHCGSEGTVLAYNQGFETGRLRELALLFPEYALPLKAIIKRVKDLMKPFQKAWCYTPAMKGSYSIKKVLPALVPELSYAELEINNGGLASSSYAAMHHISDSEELNKTRANLLEYCKMDTWAMVKILEKLYELTR
jgi:hypothetical protein